MLKNAINTFILMAFAPLAVFSQLTLMNYMDAGKNAVFSNSYISWSALPSYQYKNTNLETGFGWTFAEHHEKHFEGIRIKVSQHTEFIKRLFGISAFYLWKPFSQELREINWGITIYHEAGHFNFTAGNNYRIYKYSLKEIKLNEFDSKTARIVEPWNLIYNISYRVNNNEKPWNVALAITNLDYFLISQETNPMFNLKATWLFNNHVILFADIWHLTAGMFNMKINHFGNYFRIGGQWTI